MTEALLSVLQRSIPDSVAQSCRDGLKNLETGDFESVLTSDLAASILGSVSKDLDNADKPATEWQFGLKRQIDVLTADDNPAKTLGLFAIGYAALLSFLQSNITGPPILFAITEVLLPTLSSESARCQDFRRVLISGLAEDGIAAYKLTPNIELFCLARAILTHDTVCTKVVVGSWARARVNFVHQRLLSETSSTLQGQIFNDLNSVASTFEPRWAGDEKSQYLLERATIETYHGLDKEARSRLESATIERGFKFALIGALGKRTKFQKQDLSQLVVLAKSAEITNGTTNGGQHDEKTAEAPQSIDLNDDTLLEKISFTQKNVTSTDVQDPTAIDPSLSALDPADQPQLQTLDSIILLALASSITNTSPADGLTREETLPYAVRVLEGGSSNWQVYTQALLLRSRIEGYKSRTVERGLLQLQALVDQVISDTTASTSSDPSAPTTFLPRPKQSESAPVAERLRYIFQLASPNRWDLEAELAQRWVSLGGLRSALEIYERLELWAEAALCWAATERVDKARSMVRKQLYMTTSGQEASDDDDEKWEGPMRSSLPADAPRLFCILGDIDKDSDMYETAWDVSGQRYARAQRSLGRHYFSERVYDKAASAYSKSLKVNQLNQQSWFALGCANLNLDRFDGAVDAFTRCVQLEETDAESWTNLAAALLRQGQGQGQTDGERKNSDGDVDNQTEHEIGAEDQKDDGDDAPRTTKIVDAQKRRKEALRALQRAATLKHDSFRIWENVMIVAASVTPPDPATILTAQSNVIKLRAKMAGETCVDAEIMGRLVQHVISISDGGHYDASKPGLERRVVQVFDTQIQPLITNSRPLWKLVARLAIWRNNPAAALEAYEKAWRAVVARPGWEFRSTLTTTTTTTTRGSGGAMSGRQQQQKQSRQSGQENKAAWNEVVDATMELVDAYESLGCREVTHGLGSGSGSLVARDWKFKAKSTVSTVMGRGRDEWEGSEDWARLVDALAALKEMR